MHEKLLSALREGRPGMTPAPGARAARVAVDGVNLHVVQAGPADGPLALLLHGCPEFFWGWRLQIGALAGAGFRVWAPDQRGYGDSDRPRGVRHYRIDRLAEDAAALIAAAGRERACVVGHDWGGAVAWWLALHRPELVERLAILNAPHPLVMRRALLGSPRQMLRSWYMLLFATPWLPEAAFGAWDGALLARALRRSARPGIFTAETLAPYRASWAKPGALRSMFHWYRGLLGQAPPRTARVRRPTLVIWGARDRALGLPLAQPSIELCDDGRLVLLEDATHWLQHEEPERVNALLLEHLRPALAPVSSAARAAVPRAAAPSAGPPPEEVPSPCTNVCVLSPAQVCTGCGRTLDEIARWGGLDNARRALVVQAARRRRSGAG